MKRYTIGLITGILLTAFCVMFIGEKGNEVGRYVYGGTAGAIVDTKTGDIYRWNKGGVVLFASMKDDK